MNGWARQVSIVIRFCGSNMSVLSRRSLSCVTFRIWSSGNEVPSNISWRRYLVGFTELYTTTFSWKTNKESERENNNNNNSTEKLKVTYFFSNFVDVSIQKVAINVKMLVFERSFTYHFVRHLSFEIHEEFQHLTNERRWSLVFEFYIYEAMSYLIIRFSGKHDLACVQFKNSCRSRP